METFESYELGRTDDTVQIETREENLKIVTMMAQQCRQSVMIISRDLEPPLYDTPDFIDAIKKMILGNRKSSVRIMVFQPQLIVRRGHRLLDLAANLSSFIKIRKPAEEYKSFNESLFVADNTAYLHRKNSERFEGTINFNDKLVSKHLLLQFDEMWEKATPDVNTRRLNI